MAPTVATSSPMAPKPSESSPQVIQSPDLIASLPAPVFRLLVIAAWPISLLRSVLEVVCWKPGRRVESWILVGMWWGLCLGASHAFRYLLPPLVFLPLVPLSSLRISSNKSKIKQSSPTNPSSTETILFTLADLHAIHNLLPPSPLPAASSVYARFRQLGPVRIVRGLVVIWAAWLILGRLVGYRSLLGILGTIILLLPSAPLAHLIRLLSKSLVIRRAVALAFLFTFGSPPDQSYRFSLSHFSPVSWAKGKWAASRRPSLAFAFRPKLNLEALDGSAVVEEDEEGIRAEEPIYFRFEVHENQRWWMGLDWTSALLPQERPSWCDSHLLPASPPPSFALPPSASIILPAPTKSDPNAKIKKTATWKWIDDDWSIVRAGPAAGGAGASNTPNMAASPTVAEDESGSGFSLGHPSHRSNSGSMAISSPSVPTATATDDSPTASVGTRTQSIAEQAFTKGLERLKARTASPAASSSLKSGQAAAARTSGEFQRPRTDSQASEDRHNVDVGPAPTVPVETIPEKDDATDADGWVYGDNKWENMGSRGGLGKFTRRRRWHRRAILTETTQRLPSTTPTSTASLTSGSRTAIPVTPTKARPIVSPVEVKRRSLHEEDAQHESVLIPSSSPTTSRDDALRLRLKKAMGSVGG
ncbi:integral peroxisomal membrane peroxin-domain-containing protein [Naematelia encephala]|uniref:Integral peroxisomal membrane peroxin-domain-containing protein n=1 Tax=Naematelia encephala TaxID=71784 RepID=A0A1Y2BGX2_9TREE|nr:integral peroxisomal membrane peroxin-domain-containing protein [Naematelia encephala]